MKAIKKRVYIVSYWGINDGRTITGGIRPYKLKKFLKLKKEFDVKMIVPVLNESDDIVISESQGKVGRILSKLYNSPDYTTNWSKRVVNYFMTNVNLDEQFTIVTSMPPFGVGYVGLELKKYYQNCNWIADFRDLYTDSCDYESQFYKHKRNRAFDKSIYLSSDLSLHTSTVYTDFIKKKYKVSNVLTVRNGVDKLQLDNISQKSGCVYFGSTYGGKGTKQIFELIENLKSHQLDLGGCDFIGENDEVIKSNDKLTYLGRFPTDESYGLLKKYKFGLATLLNPKAINEGRLLQKVLDYLSHGLVPIVIYPSLEICNMFDEIGVGIKVFDNSNYAQLATEIKNSTFKVDSKRIETLTRDYQFSKILKKL